MQTQVSFVKASTDREAYEAAVDEMKEFPDAQLLRGMIGTQGGRRKFSCTLTNSKLLELYKLAKRREIVGRPVNKHVNREMTDEHKQIIANYLVQENDYILGGFEFNIASPVKVFHTDVNATILPAWLLLTKETEIYLTDGQHRSGGLETAIALRPALAMDCADVSFMFESDIEKIKQDFVDLGSTLRISESMKQDYNPRLPIFAPSARVRQEVELLGNRVDVVGNTISPKSLNLFTLTVFNTALTGIVLGRVDLTKNKANEKLMAEFAVEAKKEEWTERMVRFLNLFSERNKQWRDLTNTGNQQLVIDLREQYLHLNSAGFRLICAVAHYIFQLKDAEGKDDIEKQDSVIKELAYLNFHRTKNPLWEEIGIVSADGSLINSFGPIRIAVKKLLEHLKLGSLYEAEKSRTAKRGRPQQVRQKNINAPQVEQTALWNGSVPAQEAVR